MSSLHAFICDAVRTPIGRYAGALDGSGSAAEPYKGNLLLAGLKLLLDALASLR
jgi:hypothetical protein